MSTPEAGHATPLARNHRLKPLVGRDPHETHRVASPLELLFDLTFAVAFSVAGAQFAHLIALGHFAAGLAGFGFAMFGVVWAWINFTWFASAFDTDDWLYRLTTMVQMVGVVIFALGIPAMFASIEHGEHFDNRVMVLGYVVMRIAMVLQWLRAYHDRPESRPGIRIYLITVTVAQIGWVGLALAEMSITETFLMSAVLVLIELLGPALGERKTPTPWHPHHIAERYSLLAIIALGEGVIGTVASLSAAIGEQGWSVEAVLIVTAGIGVTFALWWVYFGIPFAELLELHRGRSFGFGYLHIPLFASIAAVGAGLHIAGYYLEGQTKISESAVVLALAAPVGLFIFTAFVIYYFMTRKFDGWLHVLEFAGGIAILVLSYLGAVNHLALGWCLLLVALAPAVIALGYEVAGHRSVSELIAGQTAAKERG